MVRDPEGNEALITVNVFLKNGESFLGKDVTSNPFGDNGSVMSFWHNDLIRSYPMADIAYIEIIPPAPKKKK